MAWNIRYDGAFIDSLKRLYRIELLQNKAVTKIADSLHFVSESIQLEAVSDSIYSCIKGKSLSFSIFIHQSDIDSGYFEDLKYYDDFEWLCRMYEGETLIFEGYLPTNTYDESWKKPPFSIDIFASEGLGMLELIELDGSMLEPAYTGLSPLWEYDNTISPLWTILHLLTKITPAFDDGGNVKIEMLSNLGDNNHDIDHIAFTTNDSFGYTEKEDCKTFVFDFFNSLGLRFYKHKNYWVLDRLIDYNRAYQGATINKTVYEYDLVTRRVNILAAQNLNLLSLNSLSGFIWQSASRTTDLQPIEALKVTIDAEKRAIHTDDIPIQEFVNISGDGNWQTPIIFHDKTSVKDSQTGKQFWKKFKYQTEVGDNTIDNIEINDASDGILMYVKDLSWGTEGLFGVYRKDIVYVPKTLSYAEAKAKFFTVSMVQNNPQGDTNEGLEGNPQGLLQAYFLVQHTDTENCILAWLDDSDQNEQEKRNPKWLRIGRGGQVEQDIAYTEPDKYYIRDILKNGQHNGGIIAAPGITEMTLNATQNKSSSINNSKPLEEGFYTLITVVYQKGRGVWKTLQKSEITFEDDSNEYQDEVRIAGSSRSAYSTDDLQIKYYGAGRMNSSDSNPDLYRAMNDMNHLMLYDSSIREYLPYPLQSDLAGENGGLTKYSIQELTIRDALKVRSGSHISINGTLKNYDINAQPLQFFDRLQDDHLIVDSKTAVLMLNEYTLNIVNNTYTIKLVTLKEN